MDRLDNIRNPNEGIIFAITGASGSGKTTYSKKLQEYYFETATRSIMYTTRKPRQGESEGKPLHFVNEEEFTKLINNDIFACYTNFCGNRVGIERKYIDDIIKKQGKDLIFDTIMSVSDLRKLSSNVVVIFLKTKTTEESINRIIQRDPNINPQELRLRKEDMLTRIQTSIECDYTVYTDSERTEEQVFKELIDIVEEARLYKNSINRMPS